MHTTRTWETTTYPQSEGNLAVADERLGVLQQPKAKTLSLVRGVAQDITEEASTADALIPAKGIIVGMGLSILLWGFIVLVMYWTRVHPLTV